MEDADAEGGSGGPQLVQDIQAIVRDLYFKHLSDTLTPFDEAVRRVMETCVQRGLRNGEASPEERELAAELGIAG